MLAREVKLEVSSKRLSGAQRYRDLYSEGEGVGFGVEGGVEVGVEVGVEFRIEVEEEFIEPS